MTKQKDYSRFINKQFGELTILSISEPIKEKKSQRYCTCKCSCGKEITVRLHNVLTEHTTSCGHIQHVDYSKYVDLQFGELTILSIEDPTTNPHHYQMCNCQCSCGKKIRVILQNLLTGHTTSCGHRVKDLSGHLTSKSALTDRSNPECRSHNLSTQIKNIYYNKANDRYVVSIVRNKVRHVKSTKSLFDAIEIKEKMLQELGER